MIPGMGKTARGRRVRGGTAATASDRRGAGGLGSLTTGQTLIMAGLLVFLVLTLAMPLRTFAEQRAELAETRENIARMEERTRELHAAGVASGRELDEAEANFAGSQADHARATAFAKAYGNGQHVDQRMQAGDVQALWYLRGDLMAVLASLHGEAQARTHVQSVTDMFRGLLPRALTARR